MLLLYCIMLFVPELSMSFSVSHDSVVCDCDRCHAFVTCITIIYNITLYSLPKFKIKNSKVKTKNKKRKETKLKMVVNYREY